jgi:cysteine desulfuration protein SufE
MAFDLEPFLFYNRRMDHFLHVKKLFATSSSQEEKYQKIIELGRLLPNMEKALMTPDKIVSGCQSIVFLHTTCVDGALFFQASSEALISKGLAALLIHAYQGRLPEFLLQNKPIFLEELQIAASLSPSRSNGLSNMFLRMQQDAVKFLVPLSQ